MAGFSVLADLEEDDGDDVVVLSAGTRKRRAAGKALEERIRNREIFDWNAPPPRTGSKPTVLRDVTNGQSRAVVDLDEEEVSDDDFIATAAMRKRRRIEKRKEAAAGTTSATRDLLLLNEGAEGCQNVPFDDSAIHDKTPTRTPTPSAADAARARAAATTTSGERASPGGTTKSSRGGGAGSGRGKTRSRVRRLEALPCLDDSALRLASTPTPTRDALPKTPQTQPLPDRVKEYAKQLASKSQATHCEWFPATEEDVSDPPGFKLCGALAATLRARGIHQLYRHQKEAIHAAVGEKKSVVVSTPTASGKSLCYVLPLLHALGQKKSARALVLFPLKALANDQLAKLKAFPEAARKALEAAEGNIDGDGEGGLNQTELKRLRGIAEITIRTCDGDSSEDDRAAIRAEKTQARCPHTGPLTTALA
jgi:hypothetical protein